MTLFRVIIQPPRLQRSQCFQPTWLERRNREFAARPGREMTSIATGVQKVIPHLVIQVSSKMHSSKKIRFRRKTKTFSHRSFLPQIFVTNRSLWVSVFSIKSVLFCTCLPDRAYLSMSSCPQAAQYLCWHQTPYHLKSKEIKTHFDRAGIEHGFSCSASYHSKTTKP